MGCSKSMEAEFNRLWDDSNSKTFPALVEAAVSTGCLAALRDGSCASDPKGSVLTMLQILVGQVATGIGSDSAAMAQVATVLSSDGFLEALPRLMATEKHRRSSCQIAVYLCPVQALGPKMVRVVEDCMKSDSIGKVGLAMLAGPLCASDRNARQLRLSGLLELLLPLAMEGEEYDALGAVCALVDSEKSDSETLKTITSEKRFMGTLVGKMQGLHGYEPWEGFRPPLNLAGFQVGRAALVEHGAVKKLRAYIAEWLKEANGGAIEQTKMRALDYAMQTLLLLMSDSREASTFCKGVCSENQV